MMDSYEFYKIRHLFPKELLNNAILLQEAGSEAGSNEYLWKWSDAVQVIEFFAQNNIPILGGDVYAYRDGKFKYTDNSWAVKTKKNEYEPVENYVARSRNLGNDYIRAFTERNGDDYYYRIVI